MAIFLTLAVLGGVLVQVQGQTGPTRQPGLLPPPPGLDLSRPIVTSLIQQTQNTAVEEPVADAELPAPRKDGAAPPGNIEPDPMRGLHHGALSLPMIPNPRMTPESRRYIRQIEGAQSVLEVVLGRIEIFKLEQAPRRIQVGDESVANYALISSTELSLQGLRVGNTQLNIWFPDPTSPDKTRLIPFLVRVLTDPENRYRLERAYKNLEKEINCMFPDSKICLILVGDKLAVTGQAKDIADANWIMRLVQANVLPEIDDSADLSRPASSGGASRSRVLPTFNRQVINLIRVPGEQQVMLQVTVAEVDRAAARSVGLNFGLTNTSGWFAGGSTLGGLGGGFASFGAGLGSVGGGIGGGGLGGLGAGNLPLALDYGQIGMAMAALRNLSYARFLAEPNLVAINGQTASFQVGANFPIPVVTGLGGGGGLQGVNYIPIGVMLNFTPFITDRDRIRLALVANVSDRDQNTAMTVINGAAIPSLMMRTFTTTVELREGQTLAIAGLVQSKLDTNGLRIPFLGAIPILGRAFGYDQTNMREQELVVLVTPRLVHPMEHKDVPPLPGHDLFEPNDTEFYLLGRLESHMGRDFRSPIRTDCSRYKQYRRMEMMYLAGPHGPTVDGPLTPDEDGPGMPAPGPHPGPLPAPPALPGSAAGPGSANLPPGVQMLPPPSGPVVPGSRTPPPGAELLPLPRESTPAPGNPQPGVIWLPNPPTR